MLPVLSIMHTQESTWQPAVESHAPVENYFISATEQCCPALHASAKRTPNSTDFSISG